MNLKIKKILSFLLVVCVLLSVFTPLSAVATSNDTGFYKIIFDGKTTGSPFYAITDDMNIQNKDVSINFRYYLEGDRGELALVNLDNSNVLLSMNKGWNNCDVLLEDYNGDFCLGFRVVDYTTASDAVVYLKNVTITVDGNNVFNPTTTQILQNELVQFAFVNESELPEENSSNDLPAYLIEFNNSPASKGVWLGGTEGDGKNKEFKVSFDYYLIDAEDGELGVVNARGGDFRDDTTATYKLYNGEHNFTATVADYQFENGYPVIASLKQTNAKIYIWNVKVTIGGSDYTNINAAPWAHSTVELNSITYGDIPFEESITTETDAYVVIFNNSPASKGVWLGGTEGEAKNKEIIVSFDYYLSDIQSGDISVGNARGGAFYDDETNSNKLKKGKNSFKSTVVNYPYENMYPTIGSDVYPTTAEIYVWNVSVTINGVDYTKVDAAPWAHTSVKVTEMKYNDIPFEDNGLEIENWAFLPYEEGEYTSPYDAQADSLRNGIYGLEDTKPTGVWRTYYISNNGNDNNNGLTPETAWATTAKLSSISTYSAVLFERGGVYRGGFKSKKTNMFYGAYGEGEKPRIYGSLQNYADASLWTEYADNIWKVEIEGSVEIGNIVFDHGKKVGVKRVKDSSFSTLAEKLVFLTTDYMFIYHNGAAYLYLDDGNPAQIHSDIEIIDRALSSSIISIEPYAKNITIENLCLKYANFGINAGNYTDNVKIRGVEIGYIGGCVSENNVARWGNGIEFWGAKNLTIENCWIYQCYDAGFTHQSNGGENPHNNIKFNSNLVEFCQYSIETWNEQGGMKNIEYTNNILRFAGYQVFDPKERYGSDSSATSLICMGAMAPVSNFKVENNIFDTSYGYVVCGYQDGVEFKNNSYLQQSQLDTYCYTKDEYYDIVPSVLSYKNTVYKAIDEYSFEKGVQFIDSSPKETIYLMHRDTGVYKVCFNDDIVGGQFCAITDDIRVDSKKLKVTFDCFYTGCDDTADIVNLNDSKVLCTLKNGWNSCSVSIDNFSGEICVGVRNKDVTSGLGATAYLKNTEITVDGVSIINIKAKQFFKIKPTYILNAYEEDVPYEAVPQDKNAYLIDFTNTSEGNPFRTLTTDPYGKDKSIEVSFNYYLTDAEDKEIGVYNVAGGDFRDEVTDRYYLYKGRHRFSYKLDVSTENKHICVAIGVLNPTIKSNAKLYIWDVTITVGGTEIFGVNAPQLSGTTIPSMQIKRFSDVELNGDADNDGIVNILDFIRFQKHLADKELCIKKSNVNINKDSYINALDMIELKKILLGCFYN